MPVCIGLIALTITAASALAASTRTEYVAQADPICHASDQKRVRLFRKHHLPKLIELENLHSADRKGQLTVARQLDLDADKVVRPFIAAVSPIPPPPGDETIIAKWIGDYRLFGRNAIGASRAIRHGKPNRGYHLVVKALLPIVQDIDELDPWGFQYCTR